MAHDVFISYSSENKPVADAICAGLEAEKIRCWIAPRDVLPGSNYGESIVNGIEQCKVLVLIYSSAANVSQAVMKEVERAVHFGKAILPFRLEDVPISKGMEFYLAYCHWLDAISPPLERHISELAAAVRGLTGSEWHGSTLASSPMRRAKPRRLLLGFAATGILLTAAILLCYKFFFAPVHGSKTGVSLGIDVLNSGESPIAEFFDVSSTALVRYRAKHDDNTLSITPVSDYLTLYRAGGPIRPLRSTNNNGDFIIAPPPQLDLKLLNEASKTIFLSRAVFHVEKSVHAEEPLLVIDGNPDIVGQLRFVNEGERGVESGTLTCQLTRVGTVADGAAVVTKSLNAFDRDIAIPVADLIATSASDLATEPSLNCSGRLRYRWKGNQGRLTEHEVTFTAQIPLRLAGKGLLPKPAAPAPTPTYACSLQSDGLNYLAQVELSQYLKAGDPDRFQITLTIPESSSHRFRIELNYNDGTEKSIWSDWIELACFVAHSTQ